MRKTPDSSLDETLISLDREIRAHQKASSSLKQEAESLLKRARNHETFAAELSETRAKLQSLETSIVSGSAPIAPRQRERKTSLAWQVRQNAFAILTAAGRPLSRAELLDGLISRDISIKSSRPLEAINKIMWHAKEFETKETGYWIVGKSLPEGSTKPRKRYKAPKTK
ncbi:hypothetical protein [Rhizobium leguminosarum]|uniref:hypothetical protein n=1 Tax=Rhizobium TaxID=379 RepID=UPI00102FEFFF|nr:hypothetical protein [Rhizobium leguminosarum]TBH12009.1 hypothetical protein ELG68_13095 [Rhizobium leguminosarum]